MRRQWYLAGAGLLTVTPLFAQFPPPSQFPSTGSGSMRASPFPPPATTPPLQITRLPEPKRPQAPIAPPGYPLPPATGQPPAASIPDASGMPSSRVEMPLPRPEEKIFLDPATITAKKINGSWQIWAGPKAIRFVGDDESGAKDIVAMMRELHPTEWISIGSPRPIIEYGLTNGKPAISAGFPRAVVPIDLRTVKVEAVRGVWCLKDAGNIIFNFGLNRADADQALAVIHRYGFNRIGMLGSDPSAPALTYFFVALDADGAKPAAANPFLVTVQENGLARTGIPVPGLGYFGEMIKIDSRKVEVRRDGVDWVVAFGNEVLARFGQDQNGARDAQRFIHDGGFTEFCHSGAAGVSFFLVNGQLPGRVPLYVQSRRLDSSGLRASPLGARWAVTDRGRHLFDVANQAEGEAVILLMKHFQFDQLCQIGSSPRTNLTFLAKGR